VYRALVEAQVRQVSYVPDAGHSALINQVREDDSIHAVALTSEEEGIGLSAGAWLGGQRSALLMQSSGVGNCVNAIASLAQACGFPLLMLITMRGEWGEANPWQVPMGRLVPGLLHDMGVSLMRLDDGEAAFATVTAAADQAFLGQARVAVLISQRLIGAKLFK